MHRTASLLSQCGIENGVYNCPGVDTWSSGQTQMSGYGLYRFWGDFDHEINYNSPSEGASSTFDLIGFHGGVAVTYQLNDSAGNINNAALPCGLSFSTSHGWISGTPTNSCTDTANETYTITARAGNPSIGTFYPWYRSQSFEVTSVSYTHLTLPTKRIV